MPRLLAGLLFLFSMIIYNISYAQEDSGIQSFQQSKDDWRRKAKESKVLDNILSKIGNNAARNITESEQVFCYQVSPATSDYTGYTIDGFAIKAFCGIINKEIKDMIVAELFMNPENIDFNKSEDCVIQPRIMLRFVRGIDNTDVLLSSPCYSFAVFYAGKATPFNTSPADAIINAIVDPLQRNRVEFISPALMNQLLPVGVAQTQEQKALLNRNNNAPTAKKSWGNQGSDNTNTPKRGWNNLNLSM